MLDHRCVLLGVLCAGACGWFSLMLVIGAGGGNLGSDAVSNRCDRQKGCTCGGGGGSTLGGGADLWVGGCAGDLGVCFSCPSVSCTSCVITPLLVGCVGGGGGAA